MTYVYTSKVQEKTLIYTTATVPHFVLCTHKCTITLFQTREANVENEKLVIFFSIGRVYATLGE